MMCNLCLTWWLAYIEGFSAKYVLSTASIKRPIECTFLMCHCRLHLRMFSIFNLIQFLVSLSLQKILHTFDELLICSNLNERHTVTV